MEFSVSSSGAPLFVNFLWCTVQKRRKPEEQWCSYVKVSVIPYKGSGIHRIRTLGFYMGNDFDVWPDTHSDSFFLGILKHLDWDIG